MLRLRCRSTAAALVLLFALAVAAPPAAAAPVAPAAGSWWSALAAGLDGLLGFFGLGGDESVTAAGSWTDDDDEPGEGEEGPGLEPDGSSVQTLPSDTDSTSLDGGMTIDPNG